MSSGEYDSGIDNASGGYPQAAFSYPSQSPARGFVPGLQNSHDTYVLGDHPAHADNPVMQAYGFGMGDASQGHVENDRHKPFG